MEHPLVRRAAVIAYLFKMAPDEVLDCDQRTFALRAAAGHHAWDMWRKEVGG